MMRWSCMIILLITTMLMATGCNNNIAATKTKNEQLAVIDIQSAIKAHHLYPAWKLIQTNYESTEQLKKEQIELVKIQLQMISNIKSLEQQGSDSFLQADYAVKMSKAYMQERKKLDEIKAVQKQKIDELLKDKFEEVEKEYSLPLFNLKSNIEIINPFPRQQQKAQQQKQELIEQLAKLQAEKKQKLDLINTQGEQLLRQTMQKYEEKATLTLRDYEKRLQNQLIMQDKEKYDKEQKALTHIPAAFDKTLQSIEKQLIEQQQAKEKLYQRMYDDILSQVNKIAIEKNITTVLSDVKVNVDAQDITQQVILALPKK